MYQDSDFQIWDDQTLPGRLGKIRAILDPKFLATVADLQAVLAELDRPIYPHVALHRRRTKNPPPDSWVALSASKRGYKKLPHFEIGLWDDRLYVWLVVLEEATNRLAVLDRVPAALVAALPTDFECANDHTDKLATQPLTPVSYQRLLDDQQVQRHAEWLLGRDFQRGSAFFTGSAEEQAAIIRETVVALMPIYQALLESE